MNRTFLVLILSSGIMRTAHKQFFVFIHPPKERMTARESEHVIHVSKAPYMAHVCAFRRAGLSIALSISSLMLSLLLLLFLPLLREWLAAVFPSSSRPAPCVHAPLVASWPPFAPGGISYSRCPAMSLQRPDRQSWIRTVCIGSNLHDMPRHLSLHNIVQGE